MPDNKKIFAILIQIFNELKTQDTNSLLYQYGRRLGFEKGVKVNSQKCCYRLLYCVHLIQIQLTMCRQEK